MTPTTPTTPTNNNNSKYQSPEEIDWTNVHLGPKISVKPIGKDERTKSATTDGGYLFDNQEDIQKQRYDNIDAHHNDLIYYYYYRRSLWDVVKKIGSNLLEGKDLVSVSFPVYLFEPRSFVHRVCDNWSMYNEFLFKAANEKDPVKRLALVIAFSLSGLHQTATALKPFNPILGETYEAEYICENAEENADVYVEQISHHPPVTAFELISRSGDFHYTGHAGYMASIRGNALKGGQTGPHSVKFQDGTAIEYELPLFWLKGIMWGDRIMEYYGVVKYTDKKNGLTCELTFHPDSQGWVKSFFKSAKTPSDTVRGDIKDADGVTVASVQGTWLGYVDLVVNNKTERLWNISKSKPCYPKAKKDVLPSDARYRSDLQMLVCGRLDDAQRCKEELEDKQRKEKKWRHSSARTKSSTNSNQVEE
jgi:hypothetical protein